MKLSKSLILGATLAGLLAANPLYATNSYDKAVSDNAMETNTAKDNSVPSTKDNTLKIKVTSAEKGALATVAAVDKNEILISVVATNKGPSSDVADLAKMMIDQHGSNLTQIIEMANSMQALPLAGGEAEKISTEGKKEMVALGSIPSGQAFDKAYVDAMVKGHQAALEIIDNKLIKTAKSEEIKKFLTDTRTVVAQHLEHAKKLQEKLKA